MAYDIDRPLVADAMNTLLSHSTMPQINDVGCSCMVTQCLNPEAVGGGSEGAREGGKELGEMAHVCIAMFRSVLFDSWRTSFYVMAIIIEWVHFAWNWCITGNPNEAG